MKKIFFTILLALLVAGNAFATKVKKIDGNSGGHLQNEFAEVFDVRSTGSYNDAKTTAVDQDSKNQLPLPVKRTFAKIFDGYQVKQVTRSTGTDGEVFSISAENEKESIIVKIDDTLEILILKQVKK